jgi:hypothetical protein
VAFLIDFWVDDGKKQSPFLRHTPYLPLDTVMLKEAIEWQDDIYEPEHRPPYIIGRDLPGKLVRMLIERGLAKPGDKRWENQEGFSYIVDAPDIPIGKIFVREFSSTDFYSIPRLARRVFSPTDIGHKAAHIHDVLCDDDLVFFTNKQGDSYQAVHPVTDAVASQIFYEAQQVACVPKSAAWVKYISTRIGGPRFSMDKWVHAGTL